MVDILQTYIILMHLFKFIYKGPTDKMSAPSQLMACYRTGDNQLPEPMLRTETSLEDV